MFTSLPSPDVVRSLILSMLSESDMPVRGLTIQRRFVDLCSPEVNGLMQNPRSNGRTETQLSNCVYRGFRQLKSQGLINTLPGSYYSLTPEGLSVVKG